MTSATRSAGPCTFPGVYNQSKSKTFFFWSQEWRRDRVPYTFDQLVPTAAERTGNFTDICGATPVAPYPADCPLDPSGVPFPGNQVPVNPSDPNVNALLSLIPGPSNAFLRQIPSFPVEATFYEVTSQPTNWRQELLRIDHNITDKERVSFHYIHDSWDTVNQVPLWTNAGSFPTVQTAFTGPGISMLARLSSTFTPTLLNEFVFSYTTDHIGAH